MTKTGHQGVGLGAALAAIGIGTLWFSSANPVFLGIAAFFGSTAPDWLEVPQGWDGRKRLSLIPHRTWTHWWPLWLAATLWSLGVGSQAAHPLLLAFCLGAWWHLAMDAPNPMGLPVWSPYRNKSLNWWKGSEHVEALVVLSLGFGALLFSVPGVLVLFR